MSIKRWKVSGSALADGFVQAADRNFASAYARWNNSAPSMLVCYVRCMLIPMDSLGLVLLALRKWHLARGYTGVHSLGVGLGVGDHRVGSFSFRVLLQAMSFGLLAKLMSVLGLYGNHRVRFAATLGLLLPDKQVLKRFNRHDPKVFICYSNKEMLVLSIL